MDKEIEILLNNYQPSAATIESLQSVDKLFLVGISGAGKDTIIKKLLKTGQYHLIVSHTTRKPRKNHGVMETDGVEYHFVNYSQLHRMLQKQEFVEAKRYGNNIYGTSIAEFKKAKGDHKIAVADIEVQGVKEYMDISPNTTKPIFLLPPNFDTWKQRFSARYEGIVGEGEFYDRMQTAVNEIEHILSCDYFSIIINDDLDDTVMQVEALANGAKQEDRDWQYGSHVARKLLEAMKEAL